MDSYLRMLLFNQAWVKERLELRPDFFEKSSRGQTPECLWIGCSDSRVPAEEITGSGPGELFVHRNIANQVIAADLSLTSVLQYGIGVLNVRHVIVCGHYGCGGIKAAMTNHDYKYVLNMWLRNVKDVYRIYSKELDAIADTEKRADRLTELNVKEQVMHLAKTSIIQRAWQNEQRPQLHGWVYGLKDGLIKPVFEMDPGAEIDPIYAYDDL